MTSSSDPSDVQKPPPQRTGSFEAYTIGDPGRAFSGAVSAPTAHIGVPDFVADAFTVTDTSGTARLIVRAACARGLAHQQYGDPRQDAHALALTEDGAYLVLAVSDGVSAAPWSHLGSHIAVTAGVEDIVRRLAAAPPQELPWREILDLLAALMREECLALQGDSDPAPDNSEVARLMAATVTLAVVETSPGDDGTHAVVTVRIGDSSGWLLEDGTRWTPLGDVKNAGNVIAESATACLPLVPDEDPVLVQASVGPGSALVLMSDGVGDPLGAGQGEVGQVLASLWATPPHPIDFLAQAAFGRKTFDDDRAAVAVWPVVS